MDMRRTDLTRMIYMQERQRYRELLKNRKEGDGASQLEHDDCKRIIGTIFDRMAETVAQGGRVELRGFGTFSIKRHAARSGRNPQTGEPVHIPERHLPCFRLGKTLKNRLNGKE